MLNFVVRFAQFLALGLLLCSLAFGQGVTGSLSGTVVDAHNAVIGGATVDARQDETGVTLHTFSSEAGLYVFPSMPVGHWTVTAEKPGFQKLVRSGIEIFIAQRQSLGLPLEVGDVKQSVEVNAAAQLLETQTS